MATDLSNLSIAELKQIKKDSKQKLKEEYKQKLIDDINKLQKARDKIKSKSKPKPKSLKNIFRSVSRIKQFLQIHHLICDEHLRELSRNMSKE